jgi:O-antigen/teichoic acid export membrane protein
VRGLGSSWLATFTAVIYSLLTVPIALRYLSADEFGLFVLLIQITGYFSLVELGMSAAAARILMDYKDTLADSHYGSVIITSFLVFTLQALVLLLIGLLAAPLIITVIGIPANLLEVATLLLQCLVVTSALTTALRVFSAVLFANKRLDVIHFISAANMFVGLALLTTILASGGGLKGLVWLFSTQASVAVLLPIFACHKLELLPRKGFWGRPSLQRFRELFIFAKDIFLVNIGNQVLEASQLMIITRTMGLTAAASWSVSTKLFALVYQLTNKIEGTAIVFFAEMMVRGEKNKLAERFRQIYQITAGIGVTALTVVASVNYIFVSLWAEAQLAWPLLLSVLTAVFIFLNTLTRCGANLIAHSKNIAALRYVYFMEAIAFVSLSLVLSFRFGFYGVLVASIVSLLLFRAPYITWRVAEYFDVPAIDFVWNWLRRPLLAAIILLPFVTTCSWLAGSASNLWAQLFIAATWVGFPAAITFMFIALPHDVRQEFAQRWPQLSLLTKC